MESLREHSEVEHLAFRLWQERGGPFGTPEIDWYRAEDKLKGEPVETPLTTFAKEVGSALGLIAARAGFSAEKA